MLALSNKKRNLQPNRVESSRELASCDVFRIHGERKFITSGRKEDCCK